MNVVYVAYMEMSMENKTDGNDNDEDNDMYVWNLLKQAGFFCCAGN